MPSEAQLEVLAATTGELLQRGYLKMQKAPNLMRPLHLAVFEPITAISFLRGRSNPFAPTVLPGLYPRLIRGVEGSTRELYRFFFQGHPMHRHRLAQLLGDELAARLAEVGLAEADGSSIEFLFRLVPYGNTVFLTDRDQGARRTTVRYVYAGGDSVLLAEFVSRNLLDRRYSRALDLCAGTAFQGHNVRDHADRVLAAEFNPRAVEFARATARMNGVDSGFTIVQSDLWSGVEGDFDLVVSNPPYYPVPPEKRDEKILDVFGGDRYGMEKPLEIYRGLDQHLRQGGRAAILAASPIVDGENLLEGELLPLARDMGLATRLHPWKRTNIKLDMEYQMREGIDYLMLYVIEAERTGHGQVQVLPMSPAGMVQAINQRLESALYRALHGGRTPSSAD